MGTALMLEQADVLINDKLSDALNRAIPYLKSKALRDKVRGHIAAKKVSYLQLKRLSKLLAVDKRAKDLFAADFDAILQESVFIFPEDTKKPLDTVRQREEQEYQRMLSGPRSGRNLSPTLDVKSVGPYLNFLLSMFGAAAGVYLISRHWFGSGVEQSVIWAIVSGLFFTILDLYYIMHTQP